MNLYILFFFCNLILISCLKDFHNYNEKELSTKRVIYGVKRMLNYTDAGQPHKPIKWKISIKKAETYTRKPFFCTGNVCDNKYNRMLLQKYYLRHFKEILYKF